MEGPQLIMLDSLGLKVWTVKRVTDPSELEAALKRGIDCITKENRPYLLDVVVAREGIGHDSEWHQGWQM